MKVRFGIVGPGNIARKMASAIGESDIAQLYGVASRNLQKAEAFCEKYGGVKTYDSYEKMFADPEIEAVYIALPNSLHLPVALQAMSYGKAVISEKPFAPKSDMTRQAVEYAREHGILFVEGMWTRWLPAMQCARRWISEGKIGTPSMMTAGFCFYSEVDLNNHRYNPELGGGALMDVGCYCIDNILYIAGEKPSAVSGVLKIGDTGVDEVGAATMLFPSGMVADARFAIRVQTDDNAWIYGTDGKILLRHFWKCREAICYDKQGQEIERFTDLVENGFLYELNEFCSLLRSGQTQSQHMSWEDSLICAEVIDQISGNK